MNKKVTSGLSVREMTARGLLTGLLLVMSFTPIGYFHTLGLDISLMMIPVAIGAMIMGPKTGLWLGFIFGATSFQQALTGASWFTSTLLNINPVGTFMLCIPTRMLMGYLAGVCFQLVYKIDKSKTVCYFVGGFLTAFLNTLLFMSVLLLFFWNTPFIQGLNENFGNLNPFLFVFAFVGLNGLLEMPASCVVGGVVSKVLAKTVCRKLA